MKVTQSCQFEKQIRRRTVEFKNRLNDSFSTKFISLNVAHNCSGFCLCDVAYFASCTFSEIGALNFFYYYYHFSVTAIIIAFNDRKYTNLTFFEFRTRHFGSHRFELLLFFISNLHSKISRPFYKYE